MMIQLPRRIGAVLVALALTCGALAPRHALAAAPSVAVMPTADTFVNSATPTTHYGAFPSVCASANAHTRYAYFRFELTDIPVGASVTTATLHLYGTTNATTGGVVTSMSDANWDETTTWETRPDHTGPTLATIGAVGSGQWVSVTLTSAITGNGRYDFAVLPVPNSRSTACYAARDYTVSSGNTAYRPLLTVEYASTPSPAAYPPPGQN
jgi:hypothetical protein